MNKVDTATRLKELMEYYKIRQSDISAKTGIPKSALSMYVSGERKPKQPRITDLASSYGVDEAWLMGYDVPMFPKKGKLTTKAQQVALAFDLANDSIQTAVCKLLDIDRGMEDYKDEVG